MRRDQVRQRLDWQSKVEARGLIWHGSDEQPYWAEGDFYRFTADQIAGIEAATETLYDLFWKMIWSNKAILPVLWSMFPDHDNLLPSSFDKPLGAHVRKPRLAREGANVAIVRGEQVIARTGGDYGGDGWVYQDLYALPEAAPGCYPVIGSWIVDGAAAGMGIREDGLITGNAARFVPHVIDG